MKQDFLQELSAQELQAINGGTRLSLWIGEVLGYLSALGETSDEWYRYALAGGK